jgi:D-beta-D-heptose 7-phosphate kinase/D-beta-D-heptose 1-phosphate adenosyltransferase
MSDDALGAFLARHRAAGHRIVLTNGCFDILHAGHVTYLQAARALGDVLVVAVNSDDSVRRLKGPDRPVHTAADRMLVLSALSCVDHVVEFGADTPVRLVERVRPDVYAKGGDYDLADLPEAPIVHSYGGAVRLLPFVARHSTTRILQRLA